MILFLCFLLDLKDNNLYLLIFLLWTPLHSNYLIYANSWTFPFSQGKGFWTTYWLIGKDGFDKPLPHAMTATSEPPVKTLDVYYAS